MIGQVLSQAGLEAFAPALEKLGITSTEILSNFSDETLMEKTGMKKMQLNKLRRAATKPAEGGNSTGKVEETPGASVPTSVPELSPEAMVRLRVKHITQEKA